MKFNIFAVLCIFLINTLCIFSNPVKSNSSEVTLTDEELKLFENKFSNILETEILKLSEKELLNLLENNNGLDLEKRNWITNLIKKLGNKIKEKAGKGFFDKIIEVATNNDISCLLAGGPTAGPWGCCKFDCMRERKQCRASCFSTKGMGCTAC